MEKFRLATQRTPLWEQVFHEEILHVSSGLQRKSIDKKNSLQAVQ
jgi:hypothetical protein